MASASTSDIRARLKALCALIPGIVTIVCDETGLKADEYPAIRVRIGTRVSTQSVSVWRRLVTYNWEIWLAIEPVARVDVDSVVDAAFNNMDEWIDIIPSFFKQHPGLDLNGDDLVYSTGDMTIGLGIDHFLSGDASLIRFILPVTIDRDVSNEE